MQNNIKLGIDIMQDVSADDRIEKIALALESIGFEVNRIQQGYILLRFRRDHRQWTHIYERDRANGFYMTCTGPEKDAATNRGFKKDRNKPTATEQRQ